MPYDFQKMQLNPLLRERPNDLKIGHIQHSFGRGVYSGFTHKKEIQNRSIISF